MPALRAPKSLIRIPVHPPRGDAIQQFAALELLMVELIIAPHVSPELSITVACAVRNAVFVEYIPQMEPVLMRSIKRDGAFGLQESR